MTEIFFARFRSLLVACFIVGLMASAGRCVFGLFCGNLRKNFSDSAYFENLILEVAAGYGALSLFVFFQGALGFYQGTKFFLSLAIFILAVVLFNVILLLRCDGFSILPSPPRRENPPLFFKRDTLSLIFDLAGITAIIVSFALAFLPPHYYDSLVYHLALPAEYIKNNSIEPAAYNLYSHFPQNAEMIFLLALKTGDEVSANIVTFILSAMLAFAVRDFIRKNFSSDYFPSAHSVAFMLLATSPFFMFLAPSTYVEFHQALLSFAAFIFVMKYKTAISLPTESSGPFTHDERYSPTGIIIISGLLAGFAIGVKYTAFASLLALNVMMLADFILMIAKRNSVAGRTATATNPHLFIRHIKDILIFNLVAFIAVSPWLVKNYIFARNPVFPFFSGFFGGASSVGWNQRAAAGYFAAITEYSHKSSVFISLVMLPYNMLVRPLSFGGGIDVLGDFGWYPLFFFGALGSVFVLIKEKSIKLFYTFLYVFTVGIVWFMTKPVLRFLVPASSVAAVLSGIGAGYFLRKKIPGIIKAGIAALLLVFVFDNFYYFNFIVRFFRPVNFLLGRENKSGYLSRTLKYSPYPAFEFINNLLEEKKSADPKVLFVGEQRSFYCNAPLVAPSVFAPNPLVEWADSAPSPSELFNKIKSQGFTLIFYNISEGKRLEPYGIFNFTDRGAYNWSAVLKNLRRKIIYQDRNSVIYDIS